MKLELSDFLEWLDEQDYTYASDSRTKNKLKVDLKGTITVYSGSTVIYRGTQPLAAIEAYNNL